MRQEKSTNFAVTSADLAELGAELGGGLRRFGKGHAILSLSAVRMRGQVSNPYTCLPAWDGPGGLVRWGWGVTGGSGVGWGVWTAMAVDSRSRSALLHVRPINSGRISSKSC